MKVGLKHQHRIQTKSNIQRRQCEQLQPEVAQIRVHNNLPTRH